MRIFLGLFGSVALLCAACVPYNIDPSSFKSEVLVKDLGLVETNKPSGSHIRVSIQSADRYETYYETKEYNVFTKVYPCSRKDFFVPSSGILKHGVDVSDSNYKKTLYIDDDMYELYFPVSFVGDEEEDYGIHKAATYDLRKSPIDICFKIGGGSPIWGVSSSKEIVLHKADLAAAIQRGKVGEFMGEK